MTQSDRWRKRDCVERYYQFKDELRRLWGNTELIVPCRLTFILSMPLSWSRKKRDRMVGTPHLSRPDSDNLEKAFFDALCPDADSHIWGLEKLKLWGYQGAIAYQEIYLTIPDEILQICRR